MGIVDSKTFKSGNSIAVRLPKEIAFAADTRVTIERNGDVITIRPAADAAKEKKRLLDLVALLEALPVPGEPEEREPIEFPDRPGLY